MSTVNLSLDQHRLVVDDNGAIINVDDDSFLIYDMITETVVPLPNSTLNDVAAFLLQKPTVVLPKSAPTSSSPSDTSLPCVNSSEDTSLSSADSSSSSTEIWIKNSGKPSAIDVQAREDLINLVKSEKYQMKLKDKKTTKKLVFEEISKELVKKGYSFGEREAWKVCQQKWKNMESETLKVLAAAGPKNTGGGLVKKPDYFDDIFDVVKDTAKACPKNVQDSFPEAKEVAEVVKGPDAGTEAPVQDEEGNPSSPFLKVKVSSKPQKKRVNEVLDFLKDDAAKKDKQNEELLKFLKRKAKADEKSKKSLLSVLKDLAGSKKKKKDGAQEESTSSSSSDEKDSA